MPGKRFTKRGPSSDVRCVLIRVIYSLSFEAAWDLGLQLFWARAWALRSKGLVSWATLLSKNSRPKWVWVSMCHTDSICINWVDLAGLRFLWILVFGGCLLGEGWVDDGGWSNWWWLGGLLVGGDWSLMMARCWWFWVVLGLRERERGAVSERVLERSVKEIIKKCKRMNILLNKCLE